jgi:hypothetical protein
MPRICEVVVRLGIDREQLVHKFHRPDRGDILLVKLHRVDKLPSRMSPAGGVQRCSDGYDQTTLLLIRHN